MKNILVIAGHGGTPYDPGACGCGQKEAVLTRELAKLAQAELQKISGVKAALYDTNNDAYKILKNGGTLPLSGIDYVLEIHFNAAANDEHGNGKTTGAEVLVHTSESGVTVEEAICKKISALGFANRGVKKRSNLLVMNTVKKKYGISHALIETCFIDDADDMKLYLSKKTQVAQAIAQGVAEGFGLNYKAATPPAQNTAQTPTKPAQTPGLKEQFDGFYNLINPLYTSLAQVPAYWREEVFSMMKSGAIKGDGKNEISIRKESLQSAVIAYRTMANENKKI